VISIRNRKETFASFPVVSKHISIRAGTENSAKRVETFVRTATVVVSAFIDIVARMAISGQFRAGHPIAVAPVAAAGIDASALARPVPITTRAFVLIYKPNQNVLESKEISLQLGLCLSIAFVNVWLINQSTQVKYTLFRRILIALRLLRNLRRPYQFRM